MAKLCSFPCASAPLCSSAKPPIPALFSVKHDGVFTEYDYTGLVGETTADVEAEYREVTRDGNIDQAVREWFLRK